MDEPSLPSRAYVLAYIALLTLLVANVLIGFINIGWGSMFIAVTIGLMQVAIIVLVLMHGLYEKVLVRLVIGGAILWFLIFVTLTLTDYITRNWVPIPGK